MPAPGVFVFYKDLFPQNLQNMDGFFHLKCFFMDGQLFTTISIKNIDSSWFKYFQHAWSVSEVLYVSGVLYVSDVLYVSGTMFISTVTIVSFNVNNTDGCFGLDSKSIVLYKNVY